MAITEYHRQYKATNRKRHLEEGVSLDGEARCSKCKQTKPRTEFKLAIQEPRGLASICRACHSAQKREWYKRNRRAAIDRATAYYKANKHNASVRVRTFKLCPNPQPCEVGGCNDAGQRHHDDYNKPLEIRWLCDKHHRQHHAGVKEAVH